MKPVHFLNYTLKLWYADNSLINASILFINNHQLIASTILRSFLNFFLFYHSKLIKKYQNAIFPSIFHRCKQTKYFSQIMYILNIKKGNEQPNPSEKFPGPGAYDPVKPHPILPRWM